MLGGLIYAHGYCRTILQRLLLYLFTILSLHIYRAHIRPRYFSVLRHVPRAKVNNQILLGD